MNKTTNDNQKTLKLRLCGLWKHQAGKTKYYSGGLCGGIKFVVVKSNNWHPKSNQPELLAYSVPRNVMEDVKGSGIPWDSFKGHRITGLWIKDGRNGKYFAGDWDPDTGLLIFPNGNKKKGSNQPDFEVFLVKRPERDRSLTTILDEEHDENSVDHQFKEFDTVAEEEFDAELTAESDSEDVFAGLGLS